MIDKQEATARLDAIEREAKELRKIIEAEPKREPRGLCWVWNGSPMDKKIAVIAGPSYNIHRPYLDGIGAIWEQAIPLTEEEMRTYRGRWE